MASFLIFLRLNAHWLAVGVMLTFLSSFGQTFFISVFAGDIRAEFGLTNGQWGSIYTLATTASAAVMIWSGTLTDRFRVRVLGVGVLICLAASALIMSRISSVPMLIAAVFLLRLFGQGMTSHVASVAMARWFVATRGRALSIAGLGISIGESLLPITFVAMLGAGVAWRNLWVLAAVIIACLLPAILILLRRERTPQSMASAQSAPGMDGRHWRRPEVLRHWLFWSMVPAVMGPAAFGTALFFHQVHLAESKGWSHLGLVATFPFYTMAAIAAMVVSGWAIDRFGAGRVMPFVHLLFGAAFVTLWQADSLGVAALAIALAGAGQGTNATVSSAFWAEYYGTRHLGAIRSATVAAMVLGTAIGPGLTGLLIDFGLPFKGQTPGIAAYFSFTMLLVWQAAARARARLPRAAEVDVIGP
jgi:sugar phosphate permease